MLREYWEGLVKHEKEFAKGDDKKFYELVGKCVDEMWEQDVKNGWETQWQDVVVWKRVGMQPAEAERRIREKVGPWLQEARKLKYKRGWVTQGVDSLGDYVDRWFGGETPAQGTRAKQPEAAKQTETQRSAENMRNMLAELRALVV